MNFIKDFNKDLISFHSEIKYEIVKWFRPIKLSDIMSVDLEYRDLIQIIPKDETEIKIGLVLEVIGDRMLIYKLLNNLSTNPNNFIVETIYPEEICELYLIRMNKLKKEIEENKLVLKEVILDYPLIIDNYIKIG